MPASTAHQNKRGMNVLSSKWPSDNDWFLFRVRVMTWGMILVALIFLLRLSAPIAIGQEGRMVSYEGRVMTWTNPVPSLAKFKFALMNLDGSVTLWSHDGSSVAGSEPATSVNLTLSTNGLFRVFLGDASLAGMSVLPPAVFTGNENVRIRVWFDDGTHGFRRLVTDQPITSLGFAMLAGSAGTALNLPDGSITQAKLANGAVGNLQLAPDAAVANLAASHSSGVGRSGVIFSTNSNATALLNSGYVRIGSTLLSENWEVISAGTTPIPRYGHSAVWSGSEMIVWGGFGDGAGGVLNDGARFNPVANAWTPVNSAGAPTARARHTAIWTGTEMIVWGGETNGPVFLNSGARYNPISDAWTSLPVAGAPSPRDFHSAIWTGTNMLIWGGLNSIPLNDGGYFNPANNQWTPLTLVNAPTARFRHTAIWSGGELMVWGGQTNLTAGMSNDGGRYNVTNLTWTPIPIAGAPEPRAGHIAVWSGGDMVVWGGLATTTNSSQVFSNGGRFFPLVNLWLPLTPAGAPAARFEAASVWTGTNLVVWGGRNLAGPLGDGSRYDFFNNAWFSLATDETPAARFQHAAVWTGTEMLVWGGYGSAPLSDGGRFNLARNAWSAIPKETVVGRMAHTAVWTGNEWIIWGGRAAGGWLNDGARFNTSANVWTPTSISTNTPTPRQGHSAVWTSTEMLVWGGKANGPLGDGAGYNPAQDSWRPIRTDQAPTPRSLHGAAWTGSKMVIWGGFSTNGLVNTGGRYDPVQDSWLPMNVSGAPSGRTNHITIWTGKELMVWGGANAAILGDGGRYDPAKDSWVAIPVSTNLTARYGHAAAWTGSEMLVWGGAAVNPLATGAIFSTNSGTWSVLTSSNAPPARVFHTAVWNGTELVVWGGTDFTNSLTDGARYNRQLNSWTALKAVPPPAGRYGHTATWTGSAMMIFGGFDGIRFLGDLGVYSPSHHAYIYMRP